MENENILTAYHESGRVVFAYLNGYSCNSMELPGTGNNASSKLNAGKDIQMVQGILNGNASALSADNIEQAKPVAEKLMTIYCAGTCAKIFYENNLQVPAELQMDISGSDLVNIEKIQAFLKKTTVDHPDHFPSQTIVSIFKKLKDDQTWKAIELLATKVLEQEDYKLSRFYIEDTLMHAGMSIQRPPTRSGYSVGLKEDNSPAPVAQQNTSPFELQETSPLDIVVKDFLKKIKSDWREDDLNAAVAYLHNLYKKYGGDK